jgi:hypothetical protein
MAIDQPLETNLEDLDWRFPILEWLVEGKLPSDQTEARRITRRAKAFVLINGELYKGGAAGILMRCILGDRDGNSGTGTGYLPGTRPDGDGHGYHFHPWVAHRPDPM